MVGARGKPAAKGNPWRSRNAIGEIAFAIGAETTNVIRVTATVKDGDAKARTARVALKAYLSGSATGAGVVGSAPTSVAIGSKGNILNAAVAGKLFDINTDTSGVFDLDITLSSGAATYYLCVIMPDGSLAISGAITFAA